jgi:acetyl-CoA acyltransferase
MHEVYVAGAAMTRFGKFPDTTIRALAEEATNGALDDAGVTASDIGMVFFSNAVAGLLTNQEMIRGQVALRHTGLLGVPMVNVENACASASSAFYLACMAVGAGAADVALAIGSEKLTHEDRARSFAAIGTAVDQQQVAELQQWASSGSAGSPLPEQADSLPADSLPAGAGAGTAEPRAPGGKRSFFMDIYAANSRAYMQRSGATRQDFAEVAVKSHRHAALNPYAQYRTEVTVEDVLASREIASPLTLLMCSPIGDGAAALVVCSPEAARRLGARVRVRACALVSGRDHGPGEPGSVDRASQAAYEQAGAGPDDLDVVELHDAAAPAELMTYEELGLCGEGEGPALLASGATRLGGRIPVNPSGGLLSKGHPIGATGCAQLVELTDQLRGRCGQRQVAGARLALAQNGGGFLGRDAAAMVVTVLST